VGAPGLARDPRFTGNRARVENRDALRAALEQKLAARPAQEWAEALTAAAVPAGVVNDIGAAFELARSLGLSPVVTIEREDGTTIDLVRNPIQLSATPPTYRAAPPRFPSGE
jgi:crotonobetainyl-CoA:carnitine CoA-transferase CaiB-like acyl-CoA transferase